MKFSFLAASVINAGRSTRGVLDTTEKLGSMTIGSGKQSAKQQQPPPPPMNMKAGRWNGPNDLLPGRSYTRKVVG